MQNIFNCRLCDIPAFITNDNDTPKMEKFIQVRKQYFSYLQTVIKKNCAYYGSPVAEEILDSLSLKLEQNALLSSLRKDIYENFLIKIISDIEKCTKERQIRNEIKKLLFDSEDKEGVNSPESDKCLETTVSNSTDNLNENEIILIDESDSDSARHDVCLSYLRQSRTVPQDSDRLSCFSDINTDDDYDVVSNDNSNLTRKLINEVDIVQASPNIQKVYSPLFNENDSSCNNADLNFVSLLSQNFVDQETSYTLSESSKLIAECMEQFFGPNEISDEYLEGNDESDYTIQLSEDENTSDDRVVDCISENKAQLESKKERDLDKRLEKMRSIFNIDEIRLKRKIHEKLTKPNKREQAERQLKRLTAWKNEKIIQLYKVSILTSQLSYKRREGMRTLFIELFGEDSDEEHEFEYGSTCQFRKSCAERISPWVVKHLMPFYRKRRIIGRQVFKRLGRHISQTIIDKIQYPDERTVKYFVCKFFSPNKRYERKSKRHI